MKTVASPKWQVGARRDPLATFYLPLATMAAYKRPESVLIVVYTAACEVLMLRRVEPSDFWQSVTGSLEWDESPMGAACRELVEETPMQYLARWRMELATTWLREEGATIVELAGRLGYQSEAAFSRAYKRVMGVPPGAMRRGGTVF